MFENDLRIKDRKLISEKYGLLRDNLSSDVIRSFIINENGGVEGRTGVLYDNNGAVMRLGGEHVSYEHLRSEATDGSMFENDMDNADLIGAHLEACVFLGINLIKADFRCAHLRLAVFSQANVTGANFTGAHCEGADFSDANLTDADFTGAKLARADFTDANLTRTILCDERGFNLQGIHLNGTAYDDYGFTVNKVHQNGTRYDDQGFAFDGYNAQGYDRNGYDRNGFNQQGYDRKGYGRDGFNQQGYDKYGYGRDGFNQRGYDRDNYGRDGFNAMGFTRAGYARDGSRYRVIRENAPIYSGHSPGEDDEMMFSTRKDLATYGISHEKFQRYFFIEHTYYLVYAGDTPNVDKVKGSPNYTVIY